MNMIFTIRALLLIGAFVAVKASNCPSERKKQADKCSQDTFFVTDKQFSPAKALADHNAYCSRQDENINCVRQYGKDCLKGFTSQTLTTALHGIKKGYKNTCKKDADKQAWMKNTAWLTKSNNRKMKDCVDKTIFNMEFIAKNVTQADQIPQSCCNYWLARKCLTGKLNDLAPDQSTRDYLENYMDTSMTSLINFLCSKQNSLATCQKIMPDAMTRMTETFGRSKVSTTKESFLITFMEVVIDI